MHRTQKRLICTSLHEGGQLQLHGLHLLCRCGRLLRQRQLLLQHLLLRVGARVGLRRGARTQMRELRAVLPVQFRSLLQSDSSILGQHRRVRFLGCRQVVVRLRHCAFAQMRKLVP
eukprot:2081253-Prymnesium_polylepis.1